MGTWGNVLRVLKVYTGEWYWGRNAEGKRLLEFCDERELCMANTWFKKTDKRKITHSAGGFETEIDFVLVGKIQKVYQGCKSDSMGTLAQAGGRRSRQKGSKQGCEKGTNHKKKDLEVE